MPDGEMVFPSVSSESCGLTLDELSVSSMMWIRLAADQTAHKFPTYAVRGSGTAAIVSVVVAAIRKI